MCRINGGVLRISFFLFLFVCGGSTATALDKELRYTASLENHSNEDDEHISTLDLSLSDNRTWEKYRNDYNLSFEYNYEHLENEENTQYEGFYYGTYEIRGPDLVWDINADFEVVAEEAGTKVDTFESQNQVTFSTGPTARLFRELRGITELSAIASRSTYSESDLDSTSGLVSLSHAYPITSSRSLTTALFFRSVEYDDEINAFADYDATGLEFVFASAGRTSDLRFRAALTAFENDLDTPDQDEYEFQYVHRMTAKSSIVFDIADILENSEEFNNRDPSLYNDLFLASLIRSKRVSLGYGYVDNEDSTNLAVYTENLEALFEDLPERDNVGLVLSWSRQVTTNQTLSTYIDYVESEVLDQITDSTTASLIYSLQHSEYISSEFELSTEIDEFEDDREQDNIIAYRFNAILYK